MLSYVKTHTFYLAIIIALFVFGKAWVDEHDKRVVAEAAQKQVLQSSQDAITLLGKQIAATNAQALSDRTALVRARAATRTPAQAVAAIPALSSLPLNARIAPDNPTQVSVDALPLYQELNQCAQDRVTLGACQSDLKAETAIATQQVIQIAALKKKPSLTKRIGHRLKQFGEDAAIVVTLLLLTKK